MVYIMLIVGFFFLVKGADLFVDGSSSIAKRFGIPSVIIGLTIVAIGTSAPEIAVSITAAIEGRNEIAVGNILGSNIFNLLVVAGLCAAIKPINVNIDILKRDLPFSILAAVALLIMGLDTVIFKTEASFISHIDGFILLILMCIFLFLTIRSARENRVVESKQPFDMPTPPIGKALISLGIGLVAIIIGGNFVVDSASAIAASFGISQTLIGLTIVAIGTSLPELVTSFVAARKGESDIAIGNVVGSNIFNIFLVLGISGVITPIPFTMFSVIDVTFLIAISLMVYAFSISSKRINRPEGILMILLYIGYT
ncbi:MAG: calcium/sodium antiporter, partial [Oscillospiraceae bacterium]